MESALKAYTEAKNRVARNLAFKWKNKISFEAYETLLYWDEYENSKFIFDENGKIAKPEFSEPNQPKTLFKQTLKYLLINIHLHCILMQWGLFMPKFN